MTCQNAELAIELLLDISGHYEPAEPDVGITWTSYCVDAIESAYVERARTVKAPDAPHGIRIERTKYVVPAELFKAHKPLLEWLLGLHIDDANEALREANL